MSDEIGAVPPPPGVIPNFRNPKDVFWTINIVSQAVAMSSITFFFLIRISVKAFVTPPFDREDCMCVVAWVFYMVYSASGVLRGGYHAWEVTRKEMKEHLKVVYGGSMIYGLNVYFVKVALLLVFIRVFRPFKKSVLIAWGLIGLMGAYYIPMFFFKMQVCRPIRGFWDRNVNADCLHQDAMLAADTVISTLTDTAILVLPIPASMQLQISWGERVKIIAYLGTGGTAALAAAVRMVLVLRMQNSTDFTVDNIRFNLFGTFEGYIGLLCTCLPSITLLINKARESSRPEAYTTRGLPPSLSRMRQGTDLSESSQARLFSGV